MIHTYLLKYEVAEPINLAMDLYGERFAVLTAMDLEGRQITFHDRELPSSTVSEPVNMALAVQ